MDAIQKKITELEERIAKLEARVRELDPGVDSSYSGESEMDAIIIMDPDDIDVDEDLSDDFDIGEELPDV